jgi:hypothetical protein
MRWRNIDAVEHNLAPDTASVPEFVTTGPLVPGGLSAGSLSCHTRKLEMECGCRIAAMTGKYRPRWADTWWWKKHTAVNVSLVVGILLLMLWKALYP